MFGCFYSKKTIEIPFMKLFYLNGVLKKTYLESHIKKNFLYVSIASDHFN